MEIVPRIVPISAFKDNYVWTLRNERYAAVVDPGEARPVLEYLEREKIELAAILAREPIVGIGPIAPIGRAIWTAPCSAETSLFVDFAQTTQFVVDSSFSQLYYSTRRGFGTLLPETRKTLRLERCRKRMEILTATKRKSRGLPTSLVI